MAALSSEPVNAAASTSTFLPYAIGLGGLLIGTLFAYLGWRLWGSSIEWAKSGISAQAAVLKKYRQAEGAAWGGLEDCFVELEYTVGAADKRKAHLRLPSKVWRRVKEGGPLGVAYLPSAPENVVAGTVFAHKIRCGIAAILMVTGALSVVIFPVGAIREVLAK